jgi:hypothetical protein
VQGIALMFSCAVSVLFALVLAGAGHGASMDASVDASGRAQPLCLLEQDAPTVSCLEGALPLSDTAMRHTLEACMTRGYWKCSAFLLSHSKKVGADLSNTVSIVSGNIRRELQLLSDSLGSLKTEGISPAYECVITLRCLACQPHRVKSLAFSPSGLTHAPRPLLPLPY